ncbi:Glyoxalase/bleomycin resistance protein/dioxygenase [Gordonia bronchialis DSM 43247]|uniref:Glyoxalase/bleomycin resistance protein/dioxygenase n=1 Tax=Gordonia bronchialis (strain ATCC 25592 / DSM 43247 / BCRC 13721 / JCM 3198 / KCTC 3076 / NBRC 16047 / NCTC 10667) TaxID=526226 RepID=D0LF82_GORB4|nr:VOC family protein [Gordonia bronchialis]ACY22777.1 Glyoxalase/bleomycin resistance protein/dioxygenase [Gordonia bronchialis DSM 43247]MCC3325558.1 VOC family protein [Gordonia bronchialis]QGS23769.1 glyoxalase/bleomycin resistance/dioxygenase family protein [Gordonia bronchialis]UAK40053.1 VOC family protein [Gordonia bronchialis]STQ65720.1 Predicted enzyme related to lactoylglutathione lyase [Gordonia bronchialis]
MEILTSRVLLRSRDPERLQQFYRHQLRLAVAREYPGGMVFHAGNGLIEIPGHRSDEASDVTGDILWLQVRDAAATERELRAGGVTIAREPVTEPWGLIEMHVTDPDGRLLIVVEIPADHPLRRDTR